MWPIHRRRGVVDVVGPHRIADPYRWLEDGDDPRTRDWLDAQARLFADARRGWTRVTEFRGLLEKLTAFDHYRIPARYACPPAGRSPPRGSSACAPAAR